MASTQASRRDVFRAIATGSYREWPAYDTTGLYDRSSLGALEEDIRTVSSAWFAHEAHNSAALVDDLHPTDIGEVADLSEKSNILANASGLDLTT